MTGKAIPLVFMGFSPFWRMFRKMENMRNLGNVHRSFYRRSIFRNLPIFVIFFMFTSMRADGCVAGSCAKRRLIVQSLS
jgi:hypothetical protein